MIGPDEAVMIANELLAGGKAPYFEAQHRQWQNERFDPRAALCLRDSSRSHIDLRETVSACEFEERQPHLRRLASAVRPFDIERPARFLRSLKGPLHQGLSSRSRRTIASWSMDSILVKLTGLCLMFHTRINYAITATYSDLLVHPDGRRELPSPVLPPYSVPSRRAAETGRS